MTVRVEHVNIDGLSQYRLVSDYDYDLTTVAGNWHVLEELTVMPPEVRNALCSNFDPDFPNFLQMAGDILKLHSVLKQAMIPICLSDEKIKWIKASDIFDNLITLEQIFDLQNQERAKKETDGTDANG